MQRELEGRETVNVAIEPVRFARLVRMAPRGGQESELEARSGLQVEVGGARIVVSRGFDEEAFSAVVEILEKRAAGRGRVGI